MNSTTNRSGLRPLATLVLGVAVTLALGLAPGTARADDAEGAGADTVYTVTKDGKTIPKKGELVEIGYSKVVLKQGDKTIPIKREDFQRYELGNVPAGIRDGDGLLGAAKDFEQAATAYKRATDDASTRAVFKMRAYVGLGNALVGAGKFDQAADAYQSAVDAPTGDMVRDAMCGLVRALVRAKNATKALTAARDAKKRYSAAELPEDAQDEAQLLEAEALEANGQDGDARSKYNVLTNSHDAKVRGRAALGAARLAYKQNDFDRADGMFRQIRDDKDVERSVRCGAALGIGEILLKKPGAMTDFQKLRATANAFAQALAVSFPARGESTDDRETALHDAARVYDALADLCKGDKDAKGKELYQGMARQCREELVRLYKTSQYRQEDEAKLAKAPEPAPAAEPRSMKTTK